MRPWVMVLAMAALVGCRTTPPLPEAGSAGYVGLLLRPNPGGGGPLVSRVLPGPLRDDAGEARAGRGDILLAVDGQPLDVEAFEALVEATAPGRTLILRLRRTGGRPDAAVPTPGEQAEVLELAVPVAAKADWRGPIAWPPDWRLPEAARLGDRAPGAFPAWLDQQVAAAELTPPVTRLRGYFAEIERRRRGANSLPRVQQIFQQPPAIVAIERAITEPLTALPAAPSLALREAAVNLHLPPPNVRPWPAPSSPAAALDLLAGHLREAGNAVDRAFAAWPAAARDALPRDLEDTLTAVGAWAVDQHEDPKRLIRTMNRSRDTDFAALLEAAGWLAGAADAPAPDFAGPVFAPPAELGDAVQGEILAWRRDGDRLLVVGGPGPNRYDLTRISAVIDLGGDDHYWFGPPATRAVQLVVDVAGDDRYVGAIGALGGVSLVVDHAGDDDYGGPALSVGSGAYGVGMVVDRGGRDVYRGGLWCQGVGVYGAGIAIDLGGENDVYRAGAFSQGLGGPRGFGLLFNDGGADHYVCRDLAPSVYGNKGIYFAMGQGCGYGFRGYDSGGIGVLMDLRGDDVYDAGEFSQGGGYYWGLGILNDRAGNDVYTATHYGQGFGCHQAAGVLADDAGDDRYAGSIVAYQGFAWDIAVGLLIDRGGDDDYQARSASQGDAAMQGIAYLLDLAGKDRYQCGGKHCQGQSWNNSYHYDESGCWSFSFFLDAGGGEDEYSHPDRRNNARQSTGTLNEKQPERSDLHGLFIDTDAAPAF